MCYHNSLKVQPRKVADYYEAALPALFTDPVFHGNGFTFPLWPVLAMNHPGHLLPAQWGLIPAWVKLAEEARKLRTFNLNARSETIFEKPSFRGPARYNRCLVPSTGFIEWQDAGKKKLPYFICLEGRELFSLAGLSSTWVDPATGEVVDTFCILTTEANPMLAKIHNSKKRMPVILSREAERRWLDPVQTEKDLHPMFQPYPEQRMRAWTIGPLVSSRCENTNVETVLKPHTYPELLPPAPELF